MRLESVAGSRGSASIGHPLPLLGLMKSAGAVGSAAAIGVATGGPAGALAGQPMAPIGSPDGRPGPGGWVAGAAFAVQLDHHVGAQDGVLLVAADPRMQLGAGRSRAGRAPGLRATNTGSRLGVAGRPLRRRAAAIVRWRTACGLRAGMPRPWRAKALRSDGQVVPSSAATALTLPSCSPTQRRARPWRGWQGRGWAASPAGGDRARAPIPLCTPL
jgi:hypothetical protein